jgi:hypothetical protein
MAAELGCDSTRRGSRLSLSSPQSSFEDERAPVELALRQEKTVTEQIL